jgi:hypothetical protein
MAGIALGKASNLSKEKKNISKKKFNRVCKIPCLLLWW